MKTWPGILSVVEAKGWHLYRSLRSSDLSDIVSQGKAESIERDVPYEILPATSRHDDVDEVQTHIVNAHRTNQLPTYEDKAHPSSQIEFVMITEKGLNIKTKGSADVYLIDEHEMENAAKFNLSTYNVHFFSCIDELCEFFLRQGIREQTPTALPEQARWEYVGTETPSDGVMIYPSNPSPVLFRGQNKRYRPCYPACVRKVTVTANALNDLCEIEQASVILNLIKTQWFNENLRKTAAMRWMSDQNIIFNETAVAQHYGCPTGYIDLSQSFEVSAFFACCKYDSTEREWRPVDEGEGVIYMVDVRHPNCGPLKPKPICLQAFPRPSEQWAWAYEIMMGQDFDMLPHVRKFLFKHDVSASRRILNQFNGGAALFPPDPLSEVADIITQSDVLPKSVANTVVNDLINDHSGLPDEDPDLVLAMVEQRMSVKFCNSQSLLVMNSVMTEDLNEIWANRFSSGEDIGVRLVRVP